VRDRTPEGRNVDAIAARWTQDSFGILARVDELQVLIDRCLDFAVTISEQVKRVRLLPRAGDLMLIGWDDLEHAHRHGTSWVLAAHPCLLMRPSGHPWRS